jgi:hypothetical protein
VPPHSWQPRERLAHQLQPVMALRCGQTGTGQGGVFLEGMVGCGGSHSLRWLAAACSPAELYFIIVYILGRLMQGCLHCANGTRPVVQGSGLIARHVRTRPPTRGEGLVMPFHRAGCAATYPCTCNADHPTGLAPHRKCVSPAADAALPSSTQCPECCRRTHCSLHQELHMMISWHQLAR